jgi:uncharacterized protein
MDEKKCFFLKLNPPRPTFVHDMTEAEGAIMQQHIVYWSDLLSKGIAIVFGPVMDPNGAFGAGVIAVDNEEDVKSVIANDPANGLNRYDYFPMHAVYNQNTLA